MLYDPKWDKKIPKVGTEPWRQVLLDAAKVIEENGWVRNAFAEDGKHCAIGAINAALGRKASNDALTGRGKNQELFKLVTDKLSQAIPRDNIPPWVSVEGPAKIMSWNDNQPYDEGQKIVVKTMRLVAKQG